MILPRAPLVFGVCYTEESQKNKRYCIVHSMALNCLIPLVILNVSYKSLIRLCIVHSARIISLFLDYKVLNVSLEQLRASERHF